jgi:hypothetical protein
VWIAFGDLVGIHRKLDLILTLLQRQGATMAADFKALEAQVKANTDAEQSAVVLLGELHAMLINAQASGDPAQLQAVIDQLGASQQALASAITQNTPAAG